MNEQSRADRQVARLLELTKSEAITWRATTKLPIWLRTTDDSTSKVGFVTEISPEDHSLKPTFRVRIFQEQSEHRSTCFIEIRSYATKFLVHPTPEVAQELVKEVSRRVFRHTPQVAPNDPEQEFEEAIGI